MLSYLQKYHPSKQIAHLLVAHYGTNYNIEFCHVPYKPMTAQNEIQKESPKEHLEKKIETFVQIWSKCPNDG